MPLPQMSVSLPALAPQLVLSRKKRCFSIDRGSSREEVIIAGEQVHPLREPTNINTIFEKSM